MEIFATQEAGESRLLGRHTRLQVKSKLGWDFEAEPFCVLLWLHVWDEGGSEMIMHSTVKWAPLRRRAEQERRPLVGLERANFKFLASPARPGPPLSCLTLSSPPTNWTRTPPPTLPVDRGTSLLSLRVVIGSARFLQLRADVVLIQFSWVTEHELLGKVLHRHRRRAVVSAARHKQDNPFKAALSNNPRNTKLSPSGRKLQHR